MASKRTTSRTPLLLLGGLVLLVALHESASGLGLWRLESTRGGQRSAVAHLDPRASLEIELRDGARVTHHRVAREGAPLRVVAEVTRMDWSGHPWTPFFKRAGLRWTVHVQAPGGRLSGEISGSLEQEAVGVLSHAAFVEHAREQIRDSVVRTLGG